MSIGKATMFGNPTLDILRRGKPGDPHRYLYQGRSIEDRGYHRPSDSFSSQVSAYFVDHPTGLSLEAPAGQEHLSVKVRWDQRSGQTHLVLSNTDTDPETGKGWGDGEVDSRPGQKEHRVETSVPLNWTEPDWAQFNDEKLRLYGFPEGESQPGWRDGLDTFQVIERPLIEGYNIAQISLRQPSFKEDGVTGEGYIVEVESASSVDKYLIHHSVTPLSIERKF